MYEWLGNIAFYSPLIINPEKLIKNPEISSDGALANLSLYLPLGMLTLNCRDNFKKCLNCKEQTLNLSSRVATKIF